MVIFCFNMLTFRMNVVGINEGLEFVEQEDQDQGYFVEQQGNLPSNLAIYATTLSTSFTNQRFWKRIKTFSPMCEMLFYPSIYT